VTRVAAEFAPAKVNLALEVRGLRPDGFHELWTVFDPLEFGDDLRFEEGGGGLRFELRFEAGTPAARQAQALGGEGERAVPDGEGNLALRAVRRLEALAGRRLEGRLLLRKRIPAGAGLGGGSSDAAAALRLCAPLLGLPGPGAGPGDSPLWNLAGELGADVPFFLAGTRAWAEGRGDRIHPFGSGPRLHYLCLFPGFGCPTSEVFGRFREAGRKGGALVESSQYGEDSVSARSLSSDRAARRAARFFEGLEKKERMGGAAPGLFNDLEDAAFALRPELGRLVEALAEAGFPGVRLSGSGSTLFLAFLDEKEADRRAEDLGTWLESRKELVSFPWSLIRTRSRIGTERDGSGA